MIQCVKMADLPYSDKVQKNVALEKIVGESKFFENIQEALYQGYRPLDFAVSIRSINDNRVVETDMGEYTTYYTNLTDVQEFIHKGYDLIMYLTSIALLHNVEYCKEVDEIMVSHSQFQPIGLYNSSDCFNPIIYSHVLMSDEGMSLLEPYLKSDRKIVSIKDMDRAMCIDALLDTLIITQSEVDNE